MDLLYDLLKLVLKFTFASFLLFTVGYSVATQEWPPNPAHFKQTLASFSQHPKENFQSLRNLLTPQPPVPVVQEVLPVLEESASLSSDEAEVERMAALYEKRAAIFQGRTGAGIHSQRLPASNDSSLATNTFANRDKILLHEIEILKARVLTLEDQLAQLQKKTPQNRK